jgi:hypothetical protein
MAKPLILFISFSFIFQVAIAQRKIISFHGKEAGGTYYAESITQDNEGNTYVTGRVNSTFDLRWRNYNKTFTPLNESLDFFIIKLDKSFSIVWCRLYGGIGQEVDPQIAADKEGNVYFTGSVYKGWELTTQQGKVMLPSNEKFAMGFLAKLDPNGDFIWAKSIHPSIGTKIKSLAVTPKNEVLVCGYLLIEDTPRSLLPYTIPANSKDNGHLSYVFVYDKNGEQTFTKYFHFQDWAYTMGATCDLNNNYYFFRDYADTSMAVKNNPRYTYGSNINKSQTGIIEKMDSKGTTIWRKEIGKLRGIERREIDINAITVDENEQVYFCGSFKDSVYSGLPNQKSLIAKGEEDILFGKLNIDGEVLWLKGLGSERYDISKSIVYSSLAKRVYIGGNYRRMIPEGTLPNQNEFIKPSGGSNLFLLEIDPDGNVTGSMPLESDYFELFNSLLLHPDLGFLIVGNVSEGKSARIIQIPVNPEYSK